IGDKNDATCELQLVAKSRFPPVFAKILERKTLENLQDMMDESKTFFKDVYEEGWRPCGRAGRVSWVARTRASVNGAPSAQVVTCLPVCFKKENQKTSYYPLVGVEAFWRSVFGRSSWDEIRREVCEAVGGVPPSELL